MTLRIEVRITTGTRQIEAYGDESESPRHFVMACAFAEAGVWGPFTDDWRRLLEREGLTEFKAHDCAHGDGEFSRYIDAERQALHREFAGVIQRHRPHLAAIVVDKEAMSTLTAAFGPTFAKPWTVAFAQLVPLVARRCSGRTTSLFAAMGMKASASKGPRSG